MTQARRTTAAAAAAVLIVIVAFGGASSGCGFAEQPREPTSLVDRELKLQVGQVEKLPFELRGATEIKVEAAHLSGDPIGLVFVSKADLLTFERERDLTFYTAMSHSQVEDRFDSGWQRLPDPGVYAVMVWRRPVEGTSTAGFSLANIRVFSR